MQLLHKLYQYEQRGHRIANAYSMDSNIYELRFEVAKIRHEESAKHSVKWYKVFMMIVVSTVEALNTRFDPFGIRLKGWSKDMNEKKDDLDDCFHRLHEEYSSKSTIHPALELAFAFFGGAFMYHLQNTAENYSELGGMLSMIAGKNGSSTTKSGADLPVNRSSPKVAGWSNSPTTPPQQTEIMTNMPLFQQQQPERRKVGRNGRRIMNGPAIPGAATMGGMDVMSMMSGGMSEPEDDVPIDFSVPKTVGGYKPSQSSENRSTPATTRKTTPAARPTEKTPERSGRGLNL